MRRRAFGRMSAVLVAGLAAVTSQPAGAQAGRGGTDGSDVRNDALLGTPNAATPVPQSNRFATTPRLEQQAPVTGGGPAVQPGDAGASAGGGRR